MISCKKCEKLMQKELDGEISVAGAAEFHKHIEECSDCHDAWQGYMAVRNLLHSDHPVETPPDFVSRLESVLEETPRVGFIEGYVVPFFLQNRIRLAMASFVLIIAGFGLLFSAYQRDPNLGGLFDETGGYADATIGIKSPGKPIFIIPVNENPNVVEENEAVIEEIEEMVRDRYHDSEIHLATD